MKKVVFIFFLIAGYAANAQVEIIPTFAEKWINSKEYLLQVAQEMPEEKYDFKPTAREMTFKEQLYHLLDNVNWLSTTHFSNGKYTKKVWPKNQTKEEILNEIKTSFTTALALVQNAKESDLNTKVSFFAGPKTKFQILNLMQDHVTHHRAQILVYLNLNKIKPPQYVGW